MNTQVNSTIDALAAFRNARVIPNLDMLRGIAILGVLFHHVDKSNVAALHTLQENGRYGVSLFFIVSGFLICTLLLREEHRHGQIDLRLFYIRRILRLSPLYYAVLLGYCVLVYGLHQFSPENQELFKQKLPYHFFYLSNFFVATGPFFFAWSLAVEEQFYLTFSVLFRWFNRTALLLLVVLLPMLKWGLLTMGWVDISNLFWKITLSFSEPMLMGVAAAFALNNDRVAHFLIRAVRSGLLWVSGGGMLALLLFTELTNKSDSNAQLLYILMTLLTVGAAISGKINVWGYALLSYVGKISYGIYLLHMLVIMAVSRIFPENPALILFFSTILVILVAGGVYRYFEHPILQYKAKFSKA